MTTKSTSQKEKGPNGGYISVYALIMMNVAILAGLANDPQQAFFGLSSVTFFAIGAIIFFVPTALVAAELAGGWSQRGGIFRWVGEGMGRGWAFTCLLILWFQTTFNLGAGMPSFAATIGFFTTDYEWAVKFASNPQHELLIMIGFLIIFWIVTYLATRGTKMFANVSKYGVTIGTIIPLVTIIILVIVWLAKGNTTAIKMEPSGLIPKWHGMPTLALAAGVFFSYAGVDLNAAHIKQLKNPKKQFPLAMLVAGIIAFLIFVVGTIIIAIVIPEDKINVIYALYSLYHDLDATIGIPWLYMLFVYVGFFATIAMWITNLAGPSFMLGQAGRSGFLPKAIQNNNKYGMPSKMLLFQAICVTIIAFIVKLLPNVEGFFVMMSQTITILYMLYYIMMFISFLRLRYNQANRPRTFKIPGGMFGAWLISIVGLASCVFGIVLSIYPPAQVKKEVGSGVTYVVTILVLVVVVLGIAFGIYQVSKRRNWVDSKNVFAPFTWEIEGLKKPGKVTSNVPSSVMAVGQDAMGMPIKRPYKADAQINTQSTVTTDSKKDSPIIQSPEKESNNTTTNELSKEPVKNNTDSLTQTNTISSNNDETK